MDLKDMVNPPTSLILLQMQATEILHSSLRLPKFLELADRVILFQVCRQVGKLPKPTFKLHRDANRSQRAGRVLVFSNP